MGAFFRNPYDLYEEVTGNPGKFFGGIKRALEIAGRLDAEDDVKDAVQSVVTAGRFEEAAEPCAALLKIMEDAVGVAPVVQKDK